MAFDWRLYWSDAHLNAIGIIYGGRASFLLCLTLSCVCSVKESAIENSYTLYILRRNLMRILLLYDLNL